MEVTTETTQYVTDLELDLSTVEQAYIGKPDQCMCGCSGKYYTDPDRIKSIYETMQKMRLRIMTFRDRIIGYIADSNNGWCYAIYLKRR